MDFVGFSNRGRLDDCMGKYLNYLLPDDSEFPLVPAFSLKYFFSSFMKLKYVP